MFNSIVCPISKEKIDSNASRLTVVANAVLMIIFIITLNPVFIYIVTFDCALRAAGYNRISPISLISSFELKLLKVSPKMVNKAPKIFASRLGLICAVLGTAFISVNMPMASKGIIAFFSVLAILDSVFNFCVGCLIYHHIVLPFFIKANPQ